MCLIPAKQLPVCVSSKNGSENRWRSKPSYWSVRHDSSERQSCGLCRRYRQSNHSCQRILQGKGKDLKIEIEVRSFDELQQVLDLGGVDRIMFDNFTPEMTKKAVEMVAGKYETESSGGITFDTLREYAECGVDFISVGALTHSVKGLDMSFKAC